MELGDRGCGLAQVLFDKERVFIGWWWWWCWWWRAWGRDVGCTFANESRLHACFDGAKMSWLIATAVVINSACFNADTQRFHKLYGMAGAVWAVVHSFIRFNEWQSGTLSCATHRSRYHNTECKTRRANKI